MTLSKAIPVTGRGGLFGCCEMLKIPYCLDNRLTDAGEVSLTRRQRSTPSKHSLFCFSYSFLLEIE
jgi:hypothetical protein